MCVGVIVVGPGSKKEPEVVVVINLVQRSVQVVTPIDVSWITGAINEDEAYRERQDAIATTRYAHGFEKRSGKPTRFDNVCQKWISKAAKAAKAEEEVKNIRIGSGSTPL